MPKVFISYRRADTGDLCDRLATRLRWALGEDVVFRDVNTILAGSSFPDALREGVAACPVTLVLIGPSWLTPVGNPPHRRIDEPDDWVRAEIASALRLGHLVIPVLAPGAPNLSYTNLPFDLAPLARFVPLPLRPDPFFDADLQALIAALRPYTDQGPAAWFLLVSGAALALISLTLMLFTKQLPTSAFDALLIGDQALAIGLGGTIFWLALSSRQWGWLGAGVGIMVSGVVQFVGTFSLPNGNLSDVAQILIMEVIAPLTAGLCLLAGWMGPRQAHAPDTLQIRWSGWHTTLAILLSLTAALLALIWLVFPALLGSDIGADLLFLVYLGIEVLLPLLIVVTGIIATAHAFIYRHALWGAGVVIVSVISFFAALLPLIAVFVPPIPFIDLDSLAFIVGGIVPIAFLLYTLAWVTSYDSRAPGAIQPVAFKIGGAR